MFARAHIAITATTKAHDSFIAIYDGAPQPLVISMSDAPKVRYATETPICAAIYRNYKGQYELLAYRRLTPGDEWPIGFFDIVQHPIATCSNIHNVPFIPGV